MNLFVVTRLPAVHDWGSFLRVRTLFIAALAFLMLSPKQVHADTNCRQVARDTQKSILAISNTTPSDVFFEFQRVLTDARVEYPECSVEIQRLENWNINADPSVPFPFPQEGDPSTYPLGPISWWWEKIYVDLFGRNTLLMIFFGWELFLAPLPILLGIVSVPFYALSALFRKLKS